MNIFQYLDSLKGTQTSYCDCESGRRVEAIFDSLGVIWCRVGQNLQDAAFASLHTDDGRRFDASPDGRVKPRDVSFCQYIDDLSGRRVKAPDGRVLTLREVYIAQADPDRERCLGLVLVNDAGEREFAVPWKGAHPRDFQLTE